MTATNESPAFAVLAAYDALPDEEKEFFRMQLQARELVRRRKHPGPRVGRPPIPNGDLISALRDCAHDLGHAPLWEEYEAWAERMGPHRRTRTPGSKRPFIRAFGSFQDARIAAGILEPGEDAALRVTKPGGLTKEDVLRHLAEVAERLGHWPTWNEYRDERLKIFEESREAGSPRALAAVTTVHRIFGSWADARGAFEDAKGAGSSR